MLSTCLILVSCGGWGQVESSVQPTVTDQVARLVRQLDDDQWARRQSAEAELMKLGPDILNLLPPTDARMGPELKERLTRVRSQLQIEYARQVVEPTRVTLQGTMSLEEALGKIEEATGNKIQGYQELQNEQVTVDFQDVPFWEAVDRVLDQSKLTVDPYGADSGTLRVVPRAEGAKDRAEHAYYEGPFRIEATHVTGVLDLNNPTFSGLRVRLSIAWEPRTKPISITLPLVDVVARDNLDREVVAANRQGRLTAAVESDLPLIEMDLPLNLPPRDAQCISTLYGAFDVMIPGKSELFEFPDPPNAQGRQERRAGAAVTLVECRRNDDIDEIILQVEYDEASNAFESYRGWILKNSSYLVDAAGERVDYGSYRVISQDERSIRIGYLFATRHPISEYKFVYEAPAMIVSEPMQFKLRDIALP